MRELLTGISGILLSFLASSCCIAPTLFVVFGVSIGGLGFFEFIGTIQKGILTWWLSECYLLPI
jgi:hypothetical protein